MPFSYAGRALGWRVAPLLEAAVEMGLRLSSGGIMLATWYGGRRCHWLRILSTLQRRLRQRSLSRFKSTWTLHGLRSLCKSLGRQRFVAGDCLPSKSYGWSSGWCCGWRAVHGRRTSSWKVKRQPALHPGWVYGRGVSAELVRARLAGARQNRLSGWLRRYGLGLPKQQADRPN